MHSEPRLVIMPVAPWTGPVSKDLPPLIAKPVIELARLSLEPRLAIGCRQVRTDRDRLTGAKALQETLGIISSQADRTLR